MGWANEGDDDADDFDGADADDDNCDDRDDVPGIKSGEGSVGELMREAAEKENGSHREIGLDRRVIQQFQDRTRNKYRNEDET